MQDLSITLVQSELIWEDPEANLKRFDKMLDGIRNPTDLIILPEMFNTGFTMNAAANAEKMGGKSMEWMARMAAIKNCTLCGSLIIEEAGKYYNRLIWMPSDGNFAYYDKKHLFRMGDEHFHYAPGDKQLIVNLKGWKVMPLICYDLRFPVWSKNKYVDGKYAYDLLIYLANWPAVRSTSWTSLIKARAIENMAYAAGVNRVGTDGRDYVYSGNSMVASPDGKLLLEITANTKAIKSTILAADELTALRAKLGVGNDWDGFNLH